MALYRLTQQGHALNGEIWNTTLHINHTGGEGADLLTTCLEAVTLLWQGPPTPAASIQQFIPTTIGCDELVLDELNGIGRNVEQHRSALSLDGTNVNDVLPYQCSVAYSTRTALPTRSGRGRGFLPVFALDQCIGGKLDPAAQSPIALAVKAMIDHINAATSFGCIVYHKASNNGTFIESIDVGDVFDTQRRRRNQLVETRVSATIA
jgi:hypothetical protein